MPGLGARCQYYFSMDINYKRFFFLCLSYEFLLDWYSECNSMIHNLSGCIAVTRMMSRQTIRVETLVSMQGGKGGIGVLRVCLRWSDVGSKLG